MQPYYNPTRRNTEDKLIIFENGRRPQYFWKWKTTSIFLKIEYDINIFQMKNDFIFFQIDDNLNLIQMEYNLIFSQMEVNLNRK